MRWMVGLVVCLTWAGVPRAWGWGTKEHVQLTRMAVSRLLADETTPAGMKRWLREATPDLPDAAGEREFFLHGRMGVFPTGVRGLAYWATEPDLTAMREKSSAKAEAVEPFGVSESRLHYLDVELFWPGAEASYRDDLSHRPALGDIPRDVSDVRYRRAGMLPFRVEQCYRSLVEALRGGKDDSAARWAGYLAHYAADNTQPHHATIDYKSRSYFPDPAEAPNVHAQLEYVMGDAPGLERLREEYWDALMRALKEPQGPAEEEDCWRASVAASLKSYTALPLIGRAAAAAARGAELDTAAFFHFKGLCEGREMSVLEMKARQQAWAIWRIEHLWRKAWREAGR